MVRDADGRFFGFDGAGRAAPAGAGLLADRVVAQGAIMTLPEPPVSRFLVGHFVWMDARRVFWFTAYGDSTADGHLLEFDESLPNENLEISFLRNGRIVGQLTPIEQAGVDDPDDYRIAWQLWQEVAPLRAAMIDNSFAAVLDDGLRAIDGFEFPAIAAVRRKVPVKP
jgi:hypothetical protein